MVEANEAAEILPGIFRWQAFSPHHQVELTSHAVKVGSFLYLFDPIPLALPALSKMVSGVKPVAIIITNQNHERDAINWRARLHTPVWTSIASMIDLPQCFHFRTSPHRWLDWSIFPVVGGSRGETAFLLKSRGLMILGDAVTNLPKYGLKLLTDKYCDDQATLAHSVRQLLPGGFRTLLMAHGSPLLENASAQVECIKEVRTA